jgi:hypothetical protein
MVPLRRAALATFLSCTTPAQPPPLPPDVHPPPVRGDARCELQPGHTQRADCLVHVEPPAQVEVHWFGPDGIETTHHSAHGAVPEHVVPLFGLPAQADIHWEATSGTHILGAGTLQTQQLPAVLDAIQFDIEGNNPGVDHLLFAYACDLEPHLVVVSTKGEVVWYQPMFTTPDLPGGSVTAVTPTSRGVAAIMSLVSVHEYTFGGELVTAIRQEDGHFSMPLHHDLTEHGDHLYALFAEAVRGPEQLDYVMDGVAVFEREGTLLAEWHLADHLPPTPVPPDEGPGFWDAYFHDAVDYSHANSLHISDDGTWLISLRHLNTVLSVVGDPFAPDFGTVLWTLVGQPGPVVGDLELLAQPDLVDPAGFEGQHHATWAPGGSVALFDNRTAPTPSRTLTLSVDEAAGTATATEAHTLPWNCTVQGAHHPLPDGSALATCADRHTVLTYDPSDDRPARWSMTMRCAGPGFGNVGPLARAIPIDLNRWR